MANSEHLAKLNGGVEGWNRWRASQALVPDLNGAALQAKDLSGFNLSSADLRGAGFKNVKLFGASLRETNLQGVDLSVVQRGLQTEQLAGADLTGATLPEELTKLYDSLENVNNISESARKLFLVVLAASLYSWLTIATTTDLNLITNRASSPLPIIQTSIPIVGFYAVAPLMLLCVYFLFPLLSAEALGRTRLSPRNFPRWTAFARQDRSLAAERLGTITPAKIECQSAFSLISPAMDLGVAGMVGGTHDDVLVLGTLPSATQSNRNRVSCSSSHNFGDRSGTTLSACRGCATRSGTEPVQLEGGSEERRSLSDSRYYRSCRNVLWACIVGSDHGSSVR
ncbi:MAG TPA: pentapeptide repeat-containing protein [Candidatus Sulfotelmatobacter sp.]|nr:pentapeptide repeat-containing protein [Candidatus Sulfotelmatobacter sp.]